MGSYINGWALPAVAADFPNEPVKQVAYGLFLGFGICLMSWCMAMLLACVDAYADRVEGKKAVRLTEEEKFHFSDLKTF